jgi:hypothetical protein
MAYNYIEQVACDTRVEFLSFATSHYAIACN